ncbi:MAG: hypothetical protein ACYTAO_13590, partial [Planctomycetota bacterium]
MLKNSFFVVLVSLSAALSQVAHTPLVGWKPYSFLGAAMYEHKTGAERLIDLTRVIEPTDANDPRKFVVHIHDALEEIPGKVRPKDEWYVMSDVELMNHVGTHIEAPFHC